MIRLVLAAVNAEVERIKIEAAPQNYRDPCAERSRL